MRLIDADALKKSICAECTLYPNRCLKDNCDWDSIYHIEHAPTIRTWTELDEKEPTKLGSYLVTYRNRFGGFEVDYDYWTIQGKFKYHAWDVVAWMIFPEPYKVIFCPNCGAKMDGGAE